jgi:antitoxin component HigA of HigAB toxin-antitoxin module
MTDMVHDNPETVKSPTYYLTRAQLQQALECAIDSEQEYREDHGYDDEQALLAAINEVLEGLDADKELHQCDGEALTLQLAAPDPSATIQELMRQRDRAQFELYQARAAQLGRYAFHFRHMALCYVLQHAPDVYNAAHADAYARIAAEGALAYEDVVAGLEAQVAALKLANEQADEALEAVDNLFTADYEGDEDGPCAEVMEAWRAVHAAIDALREAHAKAVTR